MTNRAYSATAYSKASPDIWNTTHYEWVTTPPTEPGWYLACEKFDDGSDYIFIVYLDRSADEIGGDGRRLLVAHDVDGLHYLSDYTHWLGPLPVPELSV